MLCPVDERMRKVKIIQNVICRHTYISDERTHSTKESLPFQKAFISHFVLFVIVLFDASFRILHIYLIFFSNIFAVHRISVRPLKLGAKENGK